MKSDFVVLTPELVEGTRKAIKVLEDYRQSMNEMEWPPEVLASFRFLTSELAYRLGIKEE